MKFGLFGRTGLKVSRLAIGTATFGNQADEPASFAMLDKAAAELSQSTEMKTAAALIAEAALSLGLPAT